MSPTAIWLDHSAELYSLTGPTGRHVRVLRGEVHDAGGNVLFAGSADDCQRQVWRVYTRLVPTQWERVEQVVAGADFANWQCVVE